MCSECGEKKATLFCGQCGSAYLCDECSAIIHRLKLMQSHKRIPISEATSLGMKAQMCEKHPKKELELFCVKCQKACCSICSHSVEHRTHEVIPLEEFAEKCVEEIEKSSNELKGKEEMISSSISRIEQVLKETNEVSE